MNGFERFGIQRLSPSALNLWNANPGLYALRYLGKFFDDAGPAAWRGSAVEKGLNSWMIRKEADTALAVALAAFEEDAQGLADPETEAEHALIAPMLEVAIAHCVNLPSPYFGAQTRVEHNVAGLSIPIVGYIDFVFEDGSIVDLKTTKRCPSENRSPITFGKSRSTWRRRVARVRFSTSLTSERRNTRSRKKWRKSPSRQSSETLWRFRDSWMPCLT